MLIDSYISYPISLGIAFKIKFLKEKRVKSMIVLCSHNIQGSEMGSGSFSRQSFYWLTRCF